jgi:hypothetical protein
MADIVYVLINDAMSGYVKIGRTNNLEQRLRSLDNTSVPLPFTCFYACEVGDANFVERQLHDAFGDQRVRANREFFEISPDRIVAALKLAALKEVTPGRDFVETADDQRALDKARTKRSRFNFEMAQVPVGAVLAFVRNPLITAVVKSNTTIEFMGEETSLSKAASTILQRDYGWSIDKVQGPLYWVFEEENLEERRRRLEEQE